MSHDKGQIEQHGNVSRGREELWSVVRIAFPIVVATCCRMIMDVTDFWMISRTGDSDAQAAILPAQMIMWSYIVIGMGTVAIVNTMASQSLGRGQLRNCSAYAWQSLYVAGAFWVLGALLWPFLPRVFALAGHESGIQALENRYTAIAVWTIGPTIAAAGLSNFFNGIHRPRVTMVVALEGIVLNAVVSYVLIFGKLGFEPMGIAGAAWGTVVGTGYRATRLTLRLCSRRLHERFHSRETWRFDRSKMVNLLRFGAPSGMQWCSDVTVWAVFTVVLVGSYFGKTHQLATNAAWQYLRIAFLPCMGLGMALSSIVGRSIGAGNPQQAIRMTRIVVAMMSIYMIALSLLFVTFREALIAFFCDDAEVVRIGSAVMICAAVFQLFDALGITYDSALRAAGDTLVPSMVFVVSHWLIVIGGGYLAAELFPELGSVGPWIAASFLIVGTGLWLWWRWHRRGWMKIDVFKHDQSMPGDEAENVGLEEEAIGEAVR